MPTCLRGGLANVISLNGDWRPEFLGGVRSPKYIEHKGYLAGDWLYSTGSARNCPKQPDSRSVSHAHVANDQRIAGQYASAERSDHSLALFTLQKLFIPIQRDPPLLLLLFLQL